jgi:NAD(P)-dependent dehydrogenase (short-subunit alcohol dehydrogenase family)
VSRNLDESLKDPNFTSLAYDLTVAAQAETATTSVVERTGRIDALIHLMGGFAAGAVHETDDATWARMRDLNLTAAFNMLRAALPIMRRQRSGRIVAVGSYAAQKGGKGIAAYSVFKNALVSLIRSVALENSDFGITANIVVPGTMDTPGNRAAGIVGSNLVPPESVANLIVFLASESAGHITGAAIPVPGSDL